MKLLSTLAFLLTAPLLALCTSQDEPDTLLETLGWMEGRWVLEANGSYIEETWSPARADAMVGSLRWARGEGVWLYELLAIEADEEHGLVFRLRHFDRGLEPWSSEAEGALAYPLHDLTESRAVFENPERDDPRRFVYERVDDTLTVRLEKADGSSDNAFRFTLDE